jgi:tRNA(adenine34) deaminase
LQAEHQNADHENSEHRKWMRRALALALEAEEAGEVPVGCVVVIGGEVVGRGRNSPIGLLDPTAHAEMLALRQASIAAAEYRLAGATLYCTLEPCPMCAGAVTAARVSRLVFGADDPKAGAVGSLFDVVRDPRMPHQPEVIRGVLAQECGAVLRAFFADRRTQQEPS